MKRRNLLLYAAALLAAPIATAKRAAAERLPIWAIRHDDGWTAAYSLTADDAASTAANSIDTDLRAEPAEFIPSGCWAVFVLQTKQAAEFTDPYAVPTHFGKWGWVGDTQTHRGTPWLTREEAIASMVDHNRRAIGTSPTRWAVAVEVGEPQGPVAVSIECGPEPLSLVSRTDHRPARIYRHREAVA